jgi:putative DNA primase/helicase
MNLTPKEKAAGAGEQRAAYNKNSHHYFPTNYRSAQGHIRRSGNALIGDCPCCGYKAALSITEKNGKRLYYCHAGCAQSDLWAVVRDVEGVADRVPAYQPKEKSENKGLGDYIQQLWQSSQPAKETLVAAYLSARGLATDIPDALRFLPRHKHRPTQTYWPIMLAGVTDYAANLRALHRTYLTTDGSSKAPVSPERMTLGPVMGCSVHLGAAGEQLAISEGLETGLSVMISTGIPTWAALSAGGIAGLILPPLPLACEVLICADNDENGVGQQAAESAAARWYAEGRNVRIATPPHVGKDFNDLLREVQS